MSEPQLIELRSPLGGLRVTLSSYGAAIFGIDVPDSNGEFADIVLGCDDLEDFVLNQVGLGATCGRIANRISGGKFTLDGKEYQLEQNDFPNTLHGGAAPFHKKVWEIADVVETDGFTSAVTFRLVSPDGDGGFPGELRITAEYTLSGEDELSVRYRAVCDAPTIVNLTNHVYWNLGGDCGRTVDGHFLTVKASKFLPIDDSHLVTGEIRDVDGIFDLRKGAFLEKCLVSRNPQLGPMCGFDHAMVIDGEGMRVAAKLEHPASGRWMEMSSNQPAVHVYAGGFLNSMVPGKKHTRIGPFSGLALESENFPDAVNHADFPSCVLRPSEEYIHRVAWRFGCEPADSR